MEAFVARVIASKGHPEQARRACLGIVRLGRGYDRERLESAGSRALGISSVSFGSLETILRHRLDRAGAHRPESGGAGAHCNIRGAEYYASPEVASC